MYEILKTIVGSHSHGLATKTSDVDYKSVYVLPTTDLLKLNRSVSKGTNVIDGELVDTTSYEVAHFLHLATKSNPTILEVFKSPKVEIPDSSDELNTYGDQLRELFPYVWSSIGVYNAFLGYSHDQHKKMFSDKEEFSKRKFKYAVAHIRVLLSGIELLRTGNFSTEVKDRYSWSVPKLYHLHVPIYEKVDIFGEEIQDSWVQLLMAVKSEKILIGDIVNVAEYLKFELKKAYNLNPDKVTDFNPINKWLLKVRKEMWE